MVLAPLQKLDEEKDIIRIKNVIEAEQFDETTIKEAFKELEQSIDFLPSLKWRQIVKELDRSIVDTEVENSRIKDKKLLPDKLDFDFIS